MPLTRDNNPNEIDLSKVSREEFDRWARRPLGDSHDEALSQRISDRLQQVNDSATRAMADYLRGRRPKE